MTKPVTCPRCHGPAEMVDPAPAGESGDVVRCAVERECVALTEARSTGTTAGRTIRSLRESECRT